MDSTTSNNTASGVGYDKEEAWFHKRNQELLEKLKEEGSKVKPFTINDLTHSLNLACVDAQETACCLAAWRIDDECRKTGVLVQLQSGKFVYASGSCSISGWGLDDESIATYFEKCPELSELSKDERATWEVKPKQINDWVAAGCKDPYPFT